MHLNWHDLTFVIALDRYGSVKAAATHLGTSHQTVCRRLRNLETSLGVRLIDDSGQHWALTKQGKAVCEKARLMEDVAEDLSRRPETEENEYCGRVRISSASWGLKLVILPAIRAVRSKFPDITFDLICEDHQTNIHAGDADIVLRFTDAPPKDLIGKELGKVSLGVFGTADLVQALDDGQLNEVPIVKMTGVEVHTDRFSKLGLKIGDVTSVNDLPILLEAVREGLGVGILPANVARGHHDLVVSKLISVNTSRSAWVLRHQDTRRSKRVRVVEAEITMKARAFLKG